MLQFLHPSDYFQTRPGEEKLGQQYTWLQENWKHAILELPQRYILVGVDEDFGPRANFGNAGAKGFFHATLKKLCSMQENQFASGKNMAVLGCVCPDNLDTENDKEALGKQVMKLDGVLGEILLAIFKSGKTPIVVGGGHNNALPLLKASSIALNSPMQVVNVDAHADFRATEQRHSGNSFSTAYEKGFLGYYLAVGLHKNYNNQAMLNQLDNTSGNQLFMEDWIDLGGSDDYLKNWLETQLHSQLPLGLEIDLDAIAGLKASAQTFFGFSVATIRQLISYIASSCNPRYLNITEGIPDAEGLTPKTAALLLTTFTSNSSINGHN